MSTFAQKSAILFSEERRGRGSAAILKIFKNNHLFWRMHPSHSVYSRLNIEMLMHENPLLCNNMLQHFICHFQNCPLSKSMLCWQRKAWILNLNVTENMEGKWYQFVTIKKFTKHTALIFFLGLKLILLVFGWSDKRHWKDDERPLATF